MHRKFWVITFARRLAKVLTFFSAGAFLSSQFLTLCKTYRRGHLGTSSLVWDFNFSEANYF